jgi:hypothetical protein
VERRSEGFGASFRWQAASSRLREADVGRGWLGECGVVESGRKCVREGEGESVRSDPTPCREVGSTSVRSGTNHERKRFVQLS